MTPPTGSRDLEAPVEGVTIQLGGYVPLSNITGRLHLLAESVGMEFEPDLVLSYVETGMGRLTNVRFYDCFLTPGEYTVVVDTEVCTPTGQCLDQHLGIEGEQPFEGSLHVRGEPSLPECNAVGALAGHCPEDCPDGYSCDDDGCITDTDIDAEASGGSARLGCDPLLCAPPVFLCHESLCITDCRFYGACPDATETCDLDTGVCSNPI